MAAEYQIIFNIILGVAGALGMWVLSTMSKRIETLDTDVRKLPEKYVQKADFRDAITDFKKDFSEGIGRVEKSIEAIFHKLDSKEDKSSSIGQRRD